MIEDTINRVEKISKEYFTELGFEKEAVEHLVDRLKIDLKKEIIDIKHLCNKDISDEELRDALHTIKGTLAQAGDNRLSDEIDKIYQDFYSKNIKDRIKTILRIGNES